MKDYHKREEEGGCERWNEAVRVEEKAAAVAEEAEIAAQTEGQCEWPISCIMEEHSFWFWEA